MAGKLHLGAHIATGGLDTSWRIERMSGKTFTAIAQGTIPASAHDASVGVTVQGKPGKKLVWRVFEGNQAGSATQGPFASKFPRGKRKK